MDRRLIDCNPDDLRPYPNNARLHSEAEVAALADEIAVVGFLKPIVADESLTILAGHRAREAARMLLLPEVPVLVVKGLTEEQKRIFVMADNRLAHDGRWEDQILRGELQALADDSLLLTGFTQEELSALLTPSEAFQPEPPAGPNASERKKPLKARIAAVLDAHGGRFDGGAWDMQIDADTLARLIQEELDR